MMLMICIITRY